MPEQELEMQVSLEDLYHGKTVKVEVQRPDASRGAVRMEVVPLDIKIRAGMADGSQFRIRGSPQKGGVTLTLRQKPHARFQRSADHLVVKHELSLYEALAGFRRSIRHLNGQQLWFSSESEVTRPGQLKRLRGFGMPRLRAAGKGDLLVHFSVRFPEGPLSADAARLLRQALPAAAAVGAPQSGERVHRLEVVEDEDAGGTDTDWGA
mmetsp:Transcript_44347/g.117104  ORF Transcript_44347/g.117104 Transcript_44347/m.117104 type:complete len:207 (-) Transcript_44347:66-686(-)